MPTLLSPGVNVTEYDLTTIVPSVATSVGAIAGIFNWGPVGEPILVDTETTLVSTFGKPNSNNAETWFTAANFLAYTNALYVVRTANTTNAGANSAFNAVANVTSIPNIANCAIRNPIDFSTRTSFDLSAYAIARYPGAIGNSLQISVCDTANSFSSTLNMFGGTANDFSVNCAISIGGNTATFTVTSASSNTSGANTYANTLSTSMMVGDYLYVGNSSIGTQYLPVANISTVSAGVFTVNFSQNYTLATPFQTNTSVNPTITRYWEFFNVTGAAPVQSTYQAQFGNAAVLDTMHVVVVDAGGAFTGVPGSVLETYVNVSRATDNKTIGGVANYYRTQINNNSNYIWVVGDRSNAPSNTTVNLVNSTNYEPLYLSFIEGQDGASEANASLATITSGYDLFSSPENIGVDLLLQGHPTGGTTLSNGFVANNFQLAAYITQNIAQVRKDCVAFITPDYNIIAGNQGNEAVALVAWRNTLTDSSYAVMDSGYKYQYDRYNNVYRYIPTNGDVAGLCAYTDSIRAPWWSPAGLNRGFLKNVIRMQYNPKQAARDLLYSNGVNPVITIAGEGTVLYGDKTMQTKPSAFDRINVRRLFIVLEKAISTAAKYSLFEFNDAFTQAQFKNLVVPYLRQVQGQRGITDFLVVCDGTNNTPQVVDSNQFVGDIYIKPARSINFIQLNFIAVATGVQFSEVVGKF